LLKDIRVTTKAQTLVPPFKNEKLKMAEFEFDDLTPSIVTRRVDYWSTSKTKYRS
jgi:hypothetical protein